MNRSLDNFNVNIAQLDEVDTLISYLKSKQMPVDIGDLLRWKWVWGVSAFDKFIHELVLYEMIEIFQKNRICTSAFKSFAVDLDFSTDLMHSTEEKWEFVQRFKQIVLLRHSKESFQNPNKVKEALSLIWNEQYKWQKISKALKLEEAELTQKLTIIVSRRHHIVHEADLDPVNDEKRVITIEETDEIITFLKNLSYQIFSLTRI